MDLPSQRLLRGGSMTVTDGNVSLKFQRLDFFYHRSDFRKETLECEVRRICTYRVKVWSPSRLFEWTSS